MLLQRRVSVPGSCCFLKHIVRELVTVLDGVSEHLPGSTVRAFWCIFDEANGVPVAYLEQLGERERFPQRDPL